MSARDSHPTEQAPRRPLDAPQSDRDPSSGTERRPGGPNGPQAGVQGRDGYCPHCGRGDCAPTADDFEAARQRAEAALRDLARQRDKWEWYAEDARRQTRCQRERAEAAEAALDHIRNAARLHRQGLLSTAELYAVITPACDVPATA